MVEAAQKQQNESILDFQTDRRVIKTMKKYSNSDNVKCILASSSMYAHNFMDGKIHVLTTE